MMSELRHEGSPCTISRLNMMTHENEEVVVDTASQTSANIHELKGVSLELILALGSMGIHNVAQLLAATGHPEDRAELASALQIDDDVLLELVNRADMTRISGLSVMTIELLVQAGVDRVVELRRRIPENLHGKLLSIAIHQHLPNLPRLEDVRHWVREAKQLERAVYY